MKYLLLFASLFLAVNVHAQTNIKDSLIHQDKTRYFTVHLPPAYMSFDTLAVVIFLHGGNGNMLIAQGFTRFNKVSNDKGFIVVYPQAYYESSEDGYVWADGRNTAADKAGIDDVGFINKMTDHLKSKFRLDPDRIYLCGFSNGSFLTQRIAFEANSRYAAMATLGGSMGIDLYDHGDPGRSIPMLFLLGTEDPFVPYEGGKVAGSATTPVAGIEDAVQFWVSNNGCSKKPDSTEVEDTDNTDSSTVTIYEYSNCHNNAEVVFYKVNGGGHTWCGVELEAYEEIAGETNEDINAGEELWKFFKDHNLSDSVTSVKQKAQSGIEIFPNPAAGYIEISMNQSSEGSEIAIYDILGNKKMGHALLSLASFSNHRIDISHLSKGVYFLRIGNKIKKFVKM